MKVALMHDYFYQSGGAERVMQALHRLFPEAPIYTTIADPAIIAALLPGADVRTSWMQALPGLRRHHRKYFMFYPSAVERLDFSEFDLVVSNSSAFGKGVKVRPGAAHVCYCHTPMRFGWDFEGYAAREEWSALTRIALQPMVERLRRWDIRTATRPTGYIANSTHIAQRIERYYGLPSLVVHPPVETTRFAPGDEAGDFHLVVSRLVSYKRIDLAIEAFNRLGLPLTIAGDGPARAALERIAGPTIRFVGRCDDAEVARLYASCRAFILPGTEDFGLTPLEANASGRPVIAYAAGGALDTVRDGVTGVLFDSQTVDALCSAVQRCGAIHWEKAALRAHAEHFSEGNFRERMSTAIATVLRGRAIKSVSDLDHHGTVRHGNHKRGDAVTALG